MTQQRDTTQPAGGSPVERGVRPGDGALYAASSGRANPAWHDGFRAGSALVAAAVAAERKHWRTLLSRQHVFNGSCPDAENWNDRDPECPACRALGEWRA